MSKNRSSSARSSARERLRAERRREVERAERRRRLGTVVGVSLALATAVGVTVLIQSNKPRDTRPPVAPAGATGKQDLVIAVGKPDAPVTLTAYEDFRCPGCGMVEKEIHGAVNKLEDEGKLRVEYHILSFIDRISSGNGSKHAASAAASAQDSGKFREYHDLLFANQPSELDDRFGDKKVLLDLASKVTGLKSAKFVASVTEGTHDTWVGKVQHAFDRQSAIKTTPSIIFNGKNLVNDRENPFTAQRITQLVNDAAKKG
ncbi:DsbA family protein [Streptomyces sp. NPDC002537]